MLFKNAMRPAFAAAGVGSAHMAPKANEYRAFSEAQTEADDFNAFGSAADRQRAAQNRQQPRGNRRPPQGSRPAPKKKKPASAIPTKAILMAGVALIALILVIVIIVAIFSAPGKDIKRVDDVYFSYLDSNGKYHVAFNGKEIKNEFEGEIELVAAKNNSFAYIFEQLTDEDGDYNKMYILKGSSLKEIKSRADDVICVADYEPGIVFKQGTSYQYYSSSDEGQIIKNSTADNFIISGDASTVVYTIENDKGLNQLRYFSKAISTRIGIEDETTKNIDTTPVALSNDGKYVFSAYIEIPKDETEPAEDAAVLLGYTEVSKNGEEHTAHKILTSASYGNFKDITSMNVDGDEIVFYTESATKGEISYMYAIGDTKPKQIAEGIFTYYPSDINIICPESFLDNYFLCAKEITEDDVPETEEGETPTGPAAGDTVIATYFLDKRNGARKLANTIGVFSDDQKYFYYIDEEDENNLVRIPLSSKDFAADKEAVLPEVHKFSLTEKGDVYALCQDGNEDEGTIYFKDSSRKKIANNVDIDSFCAFGDSIYFSITKDELVTVYVSTGGSAQEEVEFKSTPAEMPVIEMGIGDKGYAYFTDDNGNTYLYYTKNGKKFSLVTGEPCSIPGYNDDVVTPEEPSEE